MTADAWLIRRHPDDRRLATLLATARHLEAKSVDDALELLDLLMSAELLNKAQREADRDKARKHPGSPGRPPGSRWRWRRCSTPTAGAAPTMNRGCRRSGRRSRRSSRADLRAALTIVSETVPPPGAEDPDDWQAELLGRYQTVAGFLKLLPSVISFGRPPRARRCSRRCEPCPTCSPTGASCPTAHSRPADRRRRGERPVAAAGLRPPRARGRRGEPARLRLLRARAVLAGPQTPRHPRRCLHSVFRISVDPGPGPSCSIYASLVI